MTKLSLALACAGSAAFAACNTDTYSPRIPTKDSAQERIDAGPREGSVWGVEQHDPGDTKLAGFCDALAALAPAPESIACLPLVTYDLRTNGPWVSELGIEIADRVAGRLREIGFPGRTSTTDEVGLQLARANMSRASLSTLESVDANAARLPAEVVVFGTIRRRERVGAQDLELLAIDILAYDKRGGRIAVSTRWEVPSDEHAYKRIWYLAQTEGPWMPDSRWGLPQAGPGFSKELRLLCSELVTATAFQPAAGAGAVYVAPLDAKVTVRSLARLRAAQSSYAREYARRAETARARGTELDHQTPIVLNATEFPNLQAAEDYLVTLAEGLQTTDAGRFTETFAGILAEELVKRAPGAQVRTPTFARAADEALVAGELAAGGLAQGGLARNAAAREALATSGIAFVVAPRLEQVGDAWEFRVEVYDLAQNSVAGSASATLPPSLVPEMQRALGVDALAPVGEVQRASGPWEQIYAEARDGVVEVAGPNGRGSGFFVRDDGLVLTNEHVVRGAGTPLTVRTADGEARAAQVVAQDAALDLAALSIAALPGGAHVFAFADAVAVGAEVAVLGHPRDSSGWVLTPGHVSSMNETIAAEDGSQRRCLMYTCPTRQGSSGSPVLLANGRVAAVHSAGAVGQSLDGGSVAPTELTGFALGIPASAARVFVDGLARP